MAGRAESIRCLGLVSDAAVGTITRIRPAVRGVSVIAEGDSEPDLYDWTELAHAPPPAQLADDAPPPPPPPPPMQIQRSVSRIGGGFPTVADIATLRERIVGAASLPFAEQRMFLGNALLLTVARLLRGSSSAAKVTGMLLDEIVPVVGTAPVGTAADTNGADVLLRLLQEAAVAAAAADADAGGGARAQVALTPLGARVSEAVAALSASGYSIVVPPLSPPLNQPPQTRGLNVQSPAFRPGAAPLLPPSFLALARSLSQPAPATDGESASPGVTAPVLESPLRPLKTLRDLTTLVDAAGNSAAHHAALAGFPLTLQALEAAGASPWAASANPGWTPRSIVAGVLTRRAAALHRALMQRPSLFAAAPGALAAACAAAAAHSGEDGHGRAEQDAWLALWNVVPPEGGAAGDDDVDGGLRRSIAALREGALDDAVYYCEDAVQARGCVAALPYLALAQAAAGAMPGARVAAEAYLATFSGGAAPRAFDPAVLHALYTVDAPAGRSRPPRWAQQRAADALRALRCFDAASAALLVDPAAHTLDAELNGDGSDDTPMGAVDPETAADILEENAPSADPDSPESQWAELRAAPGARPCAPLDDIMRMTGLAHVKRVALGIYLNIGVRGLLKRVASGAALDVDDGTNMLFVGNPGTVSVHATAALATDCCSLLFILSPGQDDCRREEWVERDGRWMWKWPRPPPLPLLQ